MYEAADIHSAMLLGSGCMLLVSLLYIPFFLFLTNKEKLKIRTPKLYRVLFSSEHYSTAAMRLQGTHMSFFVVCYFVLCLCAVKGFGLMDPGRFAVFSVIAATSFLLTLAFFVLYIRAKYQADKKLLLLLLLRVFGLFLLTADVTFFLF